MTYYKRLPTVFEECQGGVWGVLVVWRCSNTKPIGKKLYQAVILGYCLFFQCPLMHKIAYIQGVWMVSVSVWMVCKVVLGFINTKSSGKTLYQVRSFFFLQCLHAL